MSGQKEIRVQAPLAVEAGPLELQEPILVSAIRQIASKQATPYLDTVDEFVALGREEPFLFYHLEGLGLLRPTRPQKSDSHVVALSCKNRTPTNLSPRANCSYYEYAIVNKSIERRNLFWPGAPREIIQTLAYGEEALSIATDGREVYLLTRNAEGKKAAMSLGGERNFWNLECEAPLNQCTDSSFFRQKENFKVNDLVVSGYDILACGAITYGRGYPACRNLSKQVSLRAHGEIITMPFNQLGNAGVVLFGAFIFLMAAANVATF